LNNVGGKFQLLPKRKIRRILRDKKAVCFFWCFL